MKINIVIFSRPGKERTNPSFLFGKKRKREKGSGSKVKKIDFFFAGKELLLIEQDKEEC